MPPFPDAQPLSRCDPGSNLRRHVRAISLACLFALVSLVSLVGAVPAQAQDSDGNLTAASGVLEPVLLRLSADTPGEAVALFDFRISDGGGGDGLPLDVFETRINVFGTSSDDERSSVTWLLSGPDASNVFGIYNSGSNLITFFGLSISVADGGAEIYTISGYFNDTSGVTPGATVILSVDGDTDLTTSPSSTAMGSTSAVNNSTGTVLGDPTPPTLNANTGIDLDEGDTGVLIDNTMLAASDETSGPAGILYTVLSPPANGSLSLGSSFTQADIDAGLLSYDSLSGTSIVDGFTFRIEDEAGNVNDNGGADFRFSMGITLLGDLGGAPYRLAFVTSSSTDGLSSNVADYNAFVNSVASGVPELAMLGNRWKAIVSTASVDARDNTDTNPASDPGVPIYLVDGSLLAIDNADLWDGSIAVPLDVQENATTSAAAFPYTGTASDGTATSPLGESIVMLGSTEQTTGAWIEMLNWGSPEAPSPVYAISDILGPPPPTPVPALSARALAVLGVLLVASARGHRAFRHS